MSTNTQPKSPLASPQAQQLLTRLSSTLNVPQQELQAHVEQFLTDRTTLQLVINYDEAAEDPRTAYDGFLTTVWHPQNRRINISDPNGENPYDEDGKLKPGIAIARPLYMHEHSGRTLNLSGFACSWDAGQIGYAYLTKEALNDLPEGRSDEELTTIMLNEVKELEAWMEGEVYAWDVLDHTGNYLTCRSGIYRTSTLEEDLLESITEEYPQVTREVAEEARAYLGRRVTFSASTT